MKITVEKTTQTEYKLPKWKQFLYCLKGDDKFRRQRQREAAALGETAFVSLYICKKNFFLELNQKGHHGIRHVNSVSLIDRTARVIFPATFGLFNLFYWLMYIITQENFKWGDNKLNPQSH